MIKATPYGLLDHSPTPLFLNKIVIKTAKSVHLYLYQNISRIKINKRCPFVLRSSYSKLNTCRHALGRDPAQFPTHFTPTTYVLHVRTHRTHIFCYWEIPKLNLGTDVVTQYDSVTSSPFSQIPLCKQTNEIEQAIHFKLLFCILVNDSIDIEPDKY